MNQIPPQLPPQIPSQVPPQVATGTRTVSELAKRVVSAIAMIVAALSTAWFGGELFAVFWAIAATVIFWEWVRMAGAQARAPRPWLVAAGAVVLLILAAIPHLSPVHWNVAAVVLLLFLGLCIAAGRRWRDRGWIAGGICYAAVIAFFPPFIREMPFNGLANILWVFAIVWTTDVAAYFVGRTFGGPRLWPRISPNKTWSGFFGGLMFGALAGVVLVLFLQKGAGQMPWLLIAVFSLIASILSQGGDLAESALKRHFGFKDSSALIPGHGGAMDRLDGFWAAVFFLGMCLILRHMAYGWIK